MTHTYLVLLFKPAFVVWNDICHASYVTTKKLHVLFVCFLYSSNVKEIKSPVKYCCTHRQCNYWTRLLFRCYFLQLLIIQLFKFYWHIFCLKFNIQILQFVEIRIQKDSNLAYWESKRFAFSVRPKHDEVQCTAYQRNGGSPPCYGKHKSLTLCRPNDILWLNI